MIKERVSIVIPVLNRAHLILETLDSIKDQVYANWECIVVDDGSLDDTFGVVQEYARKDSRFRPFKRPEDWQSGANGCRNFGYTKAEGEYIIWFDSDDLMTPNHIESKVGEIQKKGLDFLVAQTQNFRGAEMLDPYTYEKKDYGIKASDFILLKIHWYTYDVILKKEVAEKIEWNGKMKSWQDYNYFCKMLLITENGDYLDEILTHRRLHEESIQNSLNKDKLTFNAELLENRLYTYEDIQLSIDRDTKRELVFGMMNLGFELAKLDTSSDNFKKINTIVRQELGDKAETYFKIALWTGRKTGKGHWFLEKAKLR